MASRNTSTDNPIADKAASFGQELVDRASDAKNSVSDAASTVYERAAELPGGQRVKEFASAAAERLSATADYVRDHDAKRMMADVETAVKNNPGPALLIAAAFGFVLGRAFTRD
jgi:ElaB/YqjD/DUF883 family membrane-anchored ribosome-binding protein